MVAKITLPADIAETVVHLVSDGDYPDTDSVIREAFVLLEQRRESARLWESIYAADRSIMEGRGTPHEEVTLDSIRARAADKRAKGIAPNPDVMP